MTAPKSKMHYWTRAKDKAFDWAVLGALALLAALVFEPVRSKVVAIWTTPAQLRVIEEKQDQIIDVLEGLTGEDRVTEQPEDMSYVREPVNFGDPIELILFIGRTEIGAACILREIIPIFTDENGVALSSEPRRPRQQLGPQVVRRQLVLTPPDGLVAGRTRVQLQLEYTCGDNVLFELTRPVFYYANP